MVFSRATVFLLALVLTAPLGTTRGFPDAPGCGPGTGAAHAAAPPGACAGITEAPARPHDAAGTLGAVPEDMRALASAKGPAAPALPSNRFQTSLDAPEEGTSCPPDHATLSVPLDCTDALDDPDRTRQYRIVAPANRTLLVNVTMTTETGDEWLACLLRLPGGGGTCLNGGSGEAVTLPTAVASDTTYVVWLNSHRSNATLHLVASAHGWTLTDDCATGRDTTPVAAHPLSAGAACAGSLNPRDDVEDGYGLDVGAGEAATVTLLPNAEADFDLCAEDSGGVTVACALAPFGQPDPIYLSPGAGERFLLRPYVYDGAEGYILRVAAATPQDDCGLGGDAGSIQRPVPMPDPFACEGRLDPAAGDAWDVYSIAVPEGGIRIALESSGGVDACLYPPGNGWALACTGPGGALAYMVAEAGAWRVGVRAKEPSSYRVSAWSFAPSAQDDCGSGRDAGDWRRGGAYLPVVAQGACEGALRGDEGDHMDRLSFFVPEARMRFRIESATTLGYCLIGPTTGWCNNTTARPEVDVETLEPGAWNLSLWASGSSPPASVSYTVRLTLSAPRDDCGTGGDGGSFRPLPRPRQLGTPALHCAGWLMLASQDRTDAYAVDVLPGETLLVTFEGDVPDVEVCLRTAQGNPFECHRGPLAAEAPVTLSTTYLQAATLLVTVEWVGGPRPHESAYDLTVVRATDLARLVEAPPLL